VSTDPREAELVEQVLSWLQTNVLQLIITRIVPLIMASGVVLAGLAWLQDEIGIDLDPAAVATFIGTTMAAVVAAVFAYVRNHGGAAQMGSVLLQILELKKQGEADLARMSSAKVPDGPTVPPGLGGGG